MRQLSFLLGLIFLISCQAPSKEEANTSVDTQVQLVADTIVPKEPVVEEVSYDYDTTQWSDVMDLDPSITLDLRYATTNNFVKEVMYDCGRCFLRKEVAKAVVNAHQDLKQRGYGGLVMFDCYRPRPIQWKLWNKVPDPNYVADPRKGSQHNRGGAVDLSILDKEGNALDMGTAFDFFGKEAHTDYMGHPPAIQANRELLQEVMVAQNFRFIRTEWWHFSYKPKSFPISDMLWECP